jgi:hypothetical protein
VEHLYAAEVYMSLDAAADAEAYFHAAPAQRDTDAAGLSRAITLGQILLLERKYPEYADLATETIAPLLAKVIKFVPEDRQRDFLDTNWLSQYVGMLALVPLCAPDFLSLLSKNQLLVLLPRWEKLHAERNDGSRPLLDVVLHGFYQMLGREKERRETALRIQNGSGESISRAEAGESYKAVAELHAQMRELLRQR